MEAGRWQPAGRRPVAPTTATSEVPTLREAVGEYRVTVASRQKGAKEAAHRFAEVVAEAFAGKPIAGVTASDLSEWRDRLLTRNKPSTVARKLGQLSGVLTWALKERGWLAENPMAKVRFPRLGEGRARTLDAVEWEWLMRAAGSSKAMWLADTLTVLARTAMRRSELFGLRLNAIDFDACTARLADTKNGSSRLVPLDPVALAAMQRLASAARERDEAAARAQPGPVRERSEPILLPIDAVGSVSTRFSVTVRRARAAYLSACEARGEEPMRGFLHDVRLHDLRHQAISHWASTGGLSLPELMAVSGHKTPRMLTRYAHISASALAQKLRRLAGSTTAV